QKHLLKVSMISSQARAHGGPLGYFSSRAFDLCSTVDKDGVHTDMVYYAVESLKNELEKAKERDNDRENPLHNLIYGLTECFGEMIESINEERRGEPEPNQLQQQFGIDQEIGLNFNDDYQLLIPKQEVIDIADDISLPVNAHDIDHMEEPPRLDRQQPTQRRSVHFSSRSPSPHLEVASLDDQPGTSRQHRMNDGFQVM
ncbi:hypothetical protein PENTCL1PPCAC_25708, partial [Pristionchus entomophagus]